MGRINSVGMRLYWGTFVDQTDEFEKGCVIIIFCFSQYIRFFFYCVLINNKIIKVRHTVVRLRAGVVSEGGEGA